MNMLFTVAQLPWSIGYQLWPIVQQFNATSHMPIEIANLVTFSPNATLIIPNSQLISQTVSSSLFDETTLEATITNANINCSECWPMTGFTYLLIKSDYESLQNCVQSLNGLSKFLRWSYSSQQANQTVFSLGYTMLQRQQYDLISPLLKISCDGKAIDRISFIPFFSVFCIFILFILIILLRLGWIYFKQRRSEENYGPKLITESINPL